MPASLHTDPIIRLSSSSSSPISQSIMKSGRVVSNSNPSYQSEPKRSRTGSIGKDQKVAKAVASVKMPEAMDISPDELDGFLLNTTPTGLGSLSLSGGGSLSGFAGLGSRGCGLGSSGGFGMGGIMAPVGQRLSLGEAQRDWSLSDLPSGNVHPIDSWENADIHATQRSKQYEDAVMAEINEFDEQEKKMHMEFEEFKRNRGNKQQHQKRGHQQQQPQKSSIFPPQQQPSPTFFQQQQHRPQYPQQPPIVFGQSQMHAQKHAQGLRQSAPYGSFGGNKDPFARSNSYGPGSVQSSRFSDSATVVTQSTTSSSRSGNTASTNKSGSSMSSMSSSNTYSSFGTGGSGSYSSQQPKTSIGFPPTAAPAQKPVQAPPAKSSSGAVPKHELYTFFGKKPRRKQLGNDDYTWWNNGQKPHELRFTALFQDPLTGEVFHSGRYGDPKFYKVIKTTSLEGKEMELVWYTKKAFAEHGAAARCLDCLRYREALQEGHLAVQRLVLVGNDTPYTREQAPGTPPVPNEVLEKVTTNQKRIQGFLAGMGMAT